MLSRSSRWLVCIAYCLWLLVAALPISRAIAQDVAPPEPEISARAAIVVEYPSGRILYQKAMHDRLAPASTTKILTAILAIEYGQLDETVTISAADLVGESSMGLVEGETQTLRSLLYGLMLPSGNDAAMTIARSLGSKTMSQDPLLQEPLARFTAMMNARVSQLGLENSRFANPHGLDEAEHYSSAYDLASLSWYAMHLPVFNEVAAQVNQEVPGHFLLNTNELLTRYEGADGIKTGLTDNAGLCLVGSATRGGTRLISVVLNAPRWYADTAAILDYGYARIAAQPEGAGYERLSVSQRDAASGLLPGAPQVPPPHLPLLTAPQGGGPVAPVVEPAAPAPPVAEPDFAPTNLVPPPGDAGSAFLPLAFFLSIGFVLLFIVWRKLFRVNLGFTVGRVVSNTLMAFATDSDTIYTTLPAESGSRRRSPNLLTSEDGARDRHIARALQLATEEREGSAMAEFLLALRDGSLSIEELASQHRLPPTAFLALARAQTALGYYSDARATLLHGVTVLPHNRILSLALHQLTGDGRHT